jgi:hypothetical protein
MQDGNPKFGSKFYNIALPLIISEDRLAGSLSMGVGRFIESLTIK